MLGKHPFYMLQALFPKVLDFDTYHDTYIEPYSITTDNSKNSSAGCLATARKVFCPYIGLNKG